MRLSHTLIFAGALMAAAPALAQDNAAAPTNVTVTNTVDTNTTVTTDTNSMTVPVPADTMNAPADAYPPAETTAPVETKRGFPWGVLGLLGLIGLMGVRKVKS